MSDRNLSIIEEFRANGGKVGGPFEGAPMLLLHSTGAKSGQTRVNPLLYQQVGGHFAVFASKAGADTHPDWYHNLVANPEAVAEVGIELIPITARVTEGDERRQIFERQKLAFQWFADYEQKTNRVIPVVILERRST
jgi:deazaflavin-dependent oxidoreductase (nitroreductase family)